MRRIDRFVLGCSQLGGLNRPTSDHEATETLEAAWAMGVRRFDTAPHYGAGLSERRLGAFLATKPRDEFEVSTKVGRLLVPTTANTDGVDDFFGGDPYRRVLDYTADGVRRSLDESLARLGLDRVDAVYVHDPDDDLDTAVTEALPALVELRDQGVIRRVGAGMKAAAPLQRIVEQTSADEIMIAGRYTLLDRSAGERLLPLCADRGVGVIVAGVFNSGILADPRPGARFDYARADSKVVHTAVTFSELCRRHGVPMAAAAMQFALRHSAVSRVAVGCRGAVQVADNVAMLAVSVPDQLWTQLGAAAP